MSELETAPTAEENAGADGHAGAGHGADAHAGAGHGADAHAGAGHGGHDDHGGASLGPIDWRAYGAGLVGAALGLVVAAVLAVTTGYVTL